MKRLYTLFLAVAYCAIAFISYADPVNINTATAEEISSNLKGIGAAKAEAIIAYRDANGAFTTPEQLLNVKGIGEKTLENIKADLVFETEAIPQP